jgi:hypothetical protein
MMARRSLIIAVVGALVVTATVRADMTPVSRLDVGSRQSAHISGQADLRQINLSGMVQSRVAASSAARSLERSRTGWGSQSSEGRATIPKSSGFEAATSYGTPMQCSPKSGLFEPRHLSSPFADLSVTDVNWWPFEFPPETSADAGQIFDPQHPQSFTSGPSSLNLCLSALIGLGLCSSAHYVKRLHFGSIPQWYHHGGPFQIGHSLAVNPAFVCPVPACCFVQPAHTAENIIPQHRSGTIVSLWRESQFTPDVIAARGPPMTC